jgi:hypothetical protein
MLPTLILLAAAATAAPRPLAMQTYRGADFTVPAKLSDMAATCELGTTILMPEGKPKAEVLFLHGSGPFDRYGTVPGGTAIYRELALVLAQQGIASVLFDKRTLYTACATAIDQRFLPEHFFEDALSVLNAAMASPVLAGLPLYVFGHSQGATFAVEMTARGMFAPRGLILAGGLGRFPIDATVIRQLKQNAAAQTDPGTRKAAMVETKKAEDFFQRLRLGSTRQNEAFLGAYSAFWKSMQEMTEKAVTSAAKVRSSVLVIHGGADAQVTKEDYATLQTAFTAARFVQSRLFDNVTHLLTVGAEPGVSRAVAAEVAGFIIQDLAAPQKTVP